MLAQSLMNPLVRTLASGTLQPGLHFLFAIHISSPPCCGTLWWRRKQDWTFISFISFPSRCLDAWLNQWLLVSCCSMSTGHTAPAGDAHFFVVHFVQGWTNWHSTMTTSSVQKFSSFMMQCCQNAGWLASLSSMSSLSSQLNNVLILNATKHIAQPCVAAQWCRHKKSFYRAMLGNIRMQNESIQFLATSSMFVAWGGVSATIVLTQVAVNCKGMRPPSSCRCIECNNSRLNVWKMDVSNLGRNSFAHSSNLSRNSLRNIENNPLSCKRKQI